ncbi:ABC transporter permease [Corynebacterium sp.]|uniref:ABC transporter permease n=1 Tax=Corynebacterium sp. TaxID=1720 RepID=UPI0026DAC554|nr:ABC transporter permease [Corynebacterium sp.]MDO5032304.1 ABC transporter permease [Corynebacterium sp.]
MFVNTLLAEWTKLRTTASFWWTTGIILFISVGWTLLNSLNAPEAMLGMSPLTPDGLGSIMLLMGVPVLMIQGAMVVTTEYRYKLPATVYMANPNRWMVALAKLVMYAFLAAVIMFLNLVLIFVLADLTTNPSAAEAFTPFSDEAGQRLLWVYPLGAVGIVLFVQGLGWIMRQTAGTVAVSLILYLGLESVVRLLPKVGDKIIHFMPFEGFYQWTNNTVDPNAPWDNVAMGGVIFFIWAVALWVIGVVALEKRDA